MYDPYDLLEFLIVGPLAFFCIIIILYFLAIIVFHVFQAIGLYTLSKNRGYDKPWLAWIPFGNDFLTGAIADNITRCEGKSSSWRIFLPIATAVTVGLTSFLLPLVLNIMKLNSFSSDFTELLTSLGSIFTSLSAIAILILRCIALHKIFMDYNRKNGVTYLILTAVFRIHPFFLFAIRNKPSESIYYMQHPEARPQQTFYQQPYGQPQQGYYPQQNQSQYAPPQQTDTAQQQLVQPPTVAEPVTTDTDHTNSDLHV